MLTKLIVSVIILAALAGVLTIVLLIGAAPADRTEEDLDQLRFIEEYRRTHPARVRRGSGSSGT